MQITYLRELERKEYEQQHVCQIAYGECSSNQHLQGDNITVRPHCAGNVTCDKNTVRPYHEIDYSRSTGCFLWFSASAIYSCIAMRRNGQAADYLKH